jgi:hypothetical protein
MIYFFSLSSQIVSQSQFHYKRSLTLRTSCLGQFLLLLVLMALPRLTRDQLEAIGRDLLVSRRTMTSSLVLHEGVQPASKEAIEALKNIDGCDDQRDCTICLELLGEENQARKEMPCGHHFHGGCLKKWLQVQGTCPTCRHQLPSVPNMSRSERGATLNR